MNPDPLPASSGLTFILAHPRRRMAPASFQRRARRLWAREGGGASAVNVVFTDDRTVQQLNRRFRKKNKPTDVLSFSFDEPDFSGEIYVSLDRAFAQAREYGATFPEETWRLVVHGLFHLLGYTHHRPKERVRMEAREKIYLDLKCR